MILYVYFKFLVQDDSAVPGAVRAMQADLGREFPQVLSRLMKRPDADGEGRETWMETYEMPQADLARFRSRLDELAALNQLPQPRRNEVFVPIDATGSEPA